MNNCEENIYLSVVIPAYNEQERIADTLYTIKEFLSKQPYKSEIIVVDDGSRDWTTEVVKTVDIYGSEMKAQQVSAIMENVKNVGKGFSVARGILRTCGKYILFSDADLSTPIEEINKLLPILEQGCEVVIGSRKMKESEVEKKPFYRELMSIFFNSVVGLFAIRGIKDTQCGFKAFRSEAGKEIANRQKLYGFSFDVEQLFIARKLGYCIKEVPVKWSHAEGSTVDPIRDSIRMFIDVMRIRFLHRGKV
ncbi:dolichyl-phosphate beta-glucosyltransferase [Maridesulfovibrio ferrireducens]|uniref:dolichyl-phosphate beta-glucosyltransferase n=1 Tax=Maridesulfovibrio ferrireducens TaxID=246191 RepID=UPI001A272521|nr:dolichyl-phosphate beta-glucosyltransferase [Maridesulfovibrio ferrireducens]MBI9113070.1 glycosyltransferase family 2 protein [Maridesulfovibrio ferrireducens]